jgi:uncharacterized membrane protein YraQ (UPF0718 family)
MAHCHQQKTGLNKKLKITGSVFLAVVIISFIPVSWLAPLNSSLLYYIDLIWWLVLLGFLIAGIIDYFVPNEWVIGLLGGDKPSAMIYALFAGFLMSACSHGMLAIAIELYKKGAGIPAVITFLLASPWANFPLTILFFSFWGWHALLIIGGAMLIAISTGCIYLLLDRHGLIEQRQVSEFAQSENQSRAEQSIEQIVKGVSSGSLKIANLILWWLLLGIMISAVISAYIPSHWFMEYIGTGWQGLLVTLLLATVIEVCSEGSAPIAFELSAKLGSLGNPFVFLMAGVATDYTEIGLLWTTIGKKTAIWLPIVTVPQVLVLGYLFNTWVVL